VPPKPDCIVRHVTNGHRWEAAVVPDENQFKDKEADDSDDMEVLMRLWMDVPPVS